VVGLSATADAPDILILAHDWGRTNANVIALWFEMEKLNAAHKVELCMTGPDIYENDPSDDSDDSLLDQPNGLSK
jgi:hypothetical protein